MLKELTDEAVPTGVGSPLRVYAQLVFFVVFPIFVFANFVLGGMEFRATLVTLLVLMVVGVGIVALDVLAIKEFLAAWYSPDE